MPASTDRKRFPSPVPSDSLNPSWASFFDSLLPPILTTTLALSARSEAIRLNRRALVHPGYAELSIQINILCFLSRLYLCCAYRCQQRRPKQTRRLRPKNSKSRSFGRIWGLCSVTRASPPTWNATMTISGIGISKVKENNLAFVALHHTGKRLTTRRLTCSSCTKTDTCSITPLSAS